MMDSAAPYQLGSSVEDRTVLLGLRGRQLGLLATGLVFAVLIVRSSPSGSAFLVAAAAVGCASALAFLPIGGRTIEEWAPTVLRWATIRLLRRERWISPAPVLGQTATGEPHECPPPVLEGVRILEAPVESDGRTAGIVHDRKAGTYAAVLAVRGRSFQLADAPEKQRRLATWGGVLAGLARASSAVYRIQWVERTVPEDGDAMGRYLSEAVRVPRDHATLESYLQLVDRAGPAASRHEALLVVAIQAGRARRAIRQAGGGHDGAARVLLREVVNLQRRLSSAEVTVDGILGPRMVAAAIRTAFDPSARQHLARRAAAARDDGGTAPGNAWPLTTQTTWSAYRTADVWHATYWIAQWPRTPVGADFLAPLLLGTQGLRSVSLVMEPVSTLRAHREVEHAVLKGMSDEELRSQAGFASTARRRRAQETAARREHELADGHADYRLAGYITVTARSPDELEARCGEIEQSAQQSFLEIRRLDGDQDLAFACTLPLARGLR